MEFKGLTMRNNLQNEIRGSWNGIFKNTLKYPDINFCFYGLGELAERMLVVDDSKSIVILVKSTLESTGKFYVNTVYFIAKSKLSIIEIKSGNIVVAAGEPNKYDLSKHYDKLAYYIPTENGINLHASYNENKNEREKNYEDKIISINSSEYEQEKRIRFGMAIITNYNIFNF